MDVILGYQSHKLDAMSHEEIDVDGHKREVSTKLAEAWEMAKSVNMRAQNSQKIHDC